MPSSVDQKRVIEAIQRFLTAEPTQWRSIAPDVLAAVGEPRLREIVTATLARIGDVSTITDTSAGLMLVGTKGRTLVWGMADDQGRLNALLIDPRRPPRQLKQPDPLLSLFSGMTAILVATGWLTMLCWTAGSVLTWVRDILLVAVVYVFIEGFRGPGMLPWWLRRPVQLALLATLVSGWRLNRLPTGDDLALPILLGGLLLIQLVTLWRNRTHRWGEAVSVPLRFPFEDGRWYVGQGGGKRLNHHFAIPEQRGALDLVRLGRHGTQRRLTPRDLSMYACYGADVHSPCDGVVVSAATRMPEQNSSELRFMPVYGNHVFIDTGQEVVKMAHFRPGSVLVRRGERVRAGQVIAQVGNSGNTTEPHLHIHAERDGVGLDLTFSDVSGKLYRGRTIKR